MLQPDYYKVLLEIEVGRRFWQSNPSAENAHAFLSAIISQVLQVGYCNLAINACKRRRFRPAARNACNNGNSCMRDTDRFLYMWRMGAARGNCDV